MSAQQSTMQVRQQAKRDAILSKALDVFAQHGYLGTTTDRLAAEAAVSKQTLYKLFGDKDGVFAALVRGACDEIVDPFAALVEQMSTATSAEAAVRVLADQFAGSIITPHIQKLRRLVIAEAPRFPDLAALYWRSGFGRTIDSLAGCLDVLDRRGLLRIEDAERAAHHFAGLLLWIPGNRAMFDASAPDLTGAELDELISAGAQAFARAYAPSYR